MKFENPQAINILFLAFAVFLLLLFVFLKRQKKHFDFPLPLTTYIFRILTIGFLCVALAKPYLENSSKEYSLSLLVDISDSLDEGAGQQLLQKVKDDYFGPNKKISVYPFARKVSPLATDLNDLANFRSIRQAWQKLDIGYTNIEQALIGAREAQIGQALLISDGFETEGNFEQVLASRELSDLKIFPIVLQNSTRETAKVGIARVYAPLVAPAEKSVEIRVSLENSSNSDQQGILEVKHGDKLLTKESVSLAAKSSQVIATPSDPSKDGINEVTAIFTPSNNKFQPSSQVIYISGAQRERILQISSSEEDSGILDEVLKGQAYRVESIVSPSSFPDPSRYSVIILNNIARKELSESYLRSLKEYVNNGGAVIMIGGLKSFGLGGYIDSAIEEIMPVSFIPPQTVKKRVNVAVSLVLDKSRSMADDNKISFAQDAAQMVVKNLKDEDFVQVIGFDSTPFIVIKMSEVGSIRSTAIERIGRLFPAGRTNLLPALDEARRALIDVKAGRKHLIVLTDGRIPDAGPYYMELVAKLSSAGVTVSTVLVGDDTDTAMLREIASKGGGAFYQTSDPSSLPKIFLQDIKVSTGERSLRESVQFDVQALRDGLRSTTLGTFPPIRGYVQTKIKDKANLELVALAVDKADPLLASWRFGKGRTLAFTSDVNGRWSNFWIDWSQFSRFWTEVMDSLRNPQKGDQETRFDFKYYIKSGSLYLDLTLLEDPAGSVVADISFPDKTKQEANFKTVAKGRYSAVVEKPIAGRYEIKMMAGSKSLTPIAFNLPGELFGEKRDQGINVQALEQIAAATGGVINPDAKTLMENGTIKQEKQSLVNVFVLLATLTFVLEILRREQLLFGANGPVVRLRAIMKSKKS